MAWIGTDPVRVGTFFYAATPYGSPPDGGTKITFLGNWRPLLAPPVSRLATNPPSSFWARLVHTYFSLIGSSPSHDPSHASPSPAPCIPAAAPAPAGRPRKSLTARFPRRGSPSPSKYATGQLKPDCVAATMRTAVPVCLWMAVVGTSCHANRICRGRRLRNTICFS